MIFIYTVSSWYLLATCQHSGDKLVRRKTRLRLSNLFSCDSVRFVLCRNKEIALTHSKLDASGKPGLLCWQQLCSWSINILQTLYTSWRAAHARHAGFWLLSSGKLKRVAVISRYPACMVSPGPPKAWKSRRNAPYLPSIFYQVLVSLYPNCNQTT